MTWSKLKIYWIFYPNILLNEKSYGNIFINDISYKTMIGAKLFHITFDKIDDLLEFMMGLDI